MKERLSIIIPTRDRHQDLERLLESITVQGVKLLQVIIVDSGNDPINGILKKFPDLAIIYARLLPASLPAQRNLGISKISGEATLVAFLDDDIVMEDNSIKGMMEFWKTAGDDVAGASFNLINVSSERVTFTERLFLVNAGIPGVVMRSGFQSKTACVKETMRVQWIPGCAMVWRKGILDKFRFDEWFYGYAHCEDLDFSYHISRQYKLFILKDAGVTHNTKPIEKKYEFHLGIMQVINRVYFVKKHPGFSLPLCYWSCFGLFLKNIYLGLVRCQSRYLLRGLGISVGIFVSFFKNTQVKEKIKS